jgi:hypothetical protein
MAKSEAHHMGKNKRRQPPTAPIPPKPDLDSFPNDALEEQLAADIETIKAIEQELSEMVGANNLAVRWLRMLGRVLPGNACCAKSHRVDPLQNLSAERSEKSRQDTLENCRAHTEEAKATLQWYKENPKERRDQCPLWLESRAQALVEVQVLLWRSSPEGRLATMSAEVDGFRDLVEKMEKKCDPAAARFRQRYEGCARATELAKQVQTAEDPETKARLKSEMQTLAAAEISILEKMGQPAAPAGEGTKMPKPKPSAPSPFTGRWRIASMTQWDKDFIDAEVPGFIEFDAHGKGAFQFGYVRGNLHGKVGLRDGKRAVEFSWEGMDEMDQCTGRGWAVLEGEELRGMIFFHQGDESGFVARKAMEQRHPKRQ